MAYGRHLSCNTGPALMADNGALQIRGKADAMAAGTHILFSITAGTDCILRSTNIMKKWRMMQRKLRNMYYTKTLHAEQETVFP